jgi:molybdopterin molybdotransferase
MPGIRKWFPIGKRLMTRIKDTHKYIGLQEALEMALEQVYPLPVVRVPLSEGLNRVLSTDIRARVDSPSLDASLMDGYAVKSADIFRASEERPVALELAGTVAAGSRPGQVVESQHAIRVMTGGPIPMGADAVVPEEFITRQDRFVEFHRAAECGDNILPRGCDLSESQVVARAGWQLKPGLLGMLAAAGHRHVQVVRPPEVAIIGTGDEVVAPGEPLPEGKLYASNITTLDGWCRCFGFRTRPCLVGDGPDDIYRMLGSSIGQVDAVVTSGGAWAGERDRVAQALRRLGWQQVFHGIRMVPGKGIGFGLLDHKPVFMLPGGPSANVMAFLQIALPGLLRLAGHRHTGLPEMHVDLAGKLNGRHRDWTQFVLGTLKRQSGRHVFHPLLTRSRLQAVAMAEAIVAIPEGETHLPAGTVVNAQILDSLN